MKYHLVYRKNGRYEPVLEDIEPGIESIDQAALDRTSQPTEVYLEVPRFLETSNITERNFETTSIPFTAPAKEFRPFSQDFYNENLVADFPNPNPYYNVFNEQTDTKFKLPISEEYDPEGTKIDGEQVEERIIKKIREHRNKLKKEDGLPNIYDSVKPKSKGKRKSVTFKEEDSIDVQKYSSIDTTDSTAHSLVNGKKCSSVNTIELTANSLVNESLEKAVTVAEEIMKEINTELNVRTENQKMTRQNAPSRQQAVDKLKKESFSTTTTEDETCDVPKSVIESIKFYEAIDSEVQSIASKEVKIDDERKLFLIQEMKESIEVGSVRKKSDIFKKDTEKTVHSNNLKVKQHNTSRFKNALKAYSIGTQTIERIKSIAKKSFTSKSLLNICLLYLSNVLIFLTKPLLLAKSAKCTLNTLKNSKNDYNTSSNNEVYIDEKKYTKEEKILSRRKLSGSEMAQLSLKKPKELTQRMDTVISEFHNKLNIRDTFSAVRNSNETSKVTAYSESFSDNLIKNSVSERASNTFNSLEWVAKMSQEEREHVKKDIKLATLAAAKRVAERRKTGQSQTNDYTKEFDVEPMDIATYIAIVESHVYTNKDAIFDDYVLNLNKGLTTEERDYTRLQSEYMLAKSYKLSDRSEKKVDESLLKRSALVEEEKLAGTSRIAEETNIQESTLDTEYVATVKVEHKPAPFISTVTTHETRFEAHKEASEQKILNITTDEACTVNKIKDKVIIEHKDETATKTNLENIITVETSPALIIQDLDEDQVESLTITEIADEAPNITLESELNTAQVMGKETLRQISAEFKEVELIKEEDFNTLQNKPEFIIEDKKLEEAYIINKAIIEEIRLVFDEIIMEPINIIIPKEELMPSIQVNELTKANAHCIASVYFVTFESENIQNITIEPLDQQFSKPSVEPEIYSCALATSTALNEQINTDLLETDFFEIKPITEENVNSIEEMKEIFKAFSFCTASCTDIIASMINADVLNVDELKHEIAEYILEPKVFVTILPIAKPCVSQISVTCEETDIVQSEKFSEEKSICTREVKDFHCGYVVCTPFYQSVEFTFENSEVFNVDGAKEEYCTPSLEPLVFKTALCVATSVLMQISIVYNEVDLIVTSNIQEETAQVLVESDKFVTVRPICLALAEIADMTLEKSNLFEVKMFKEEFSTLSVVPEKLTRIPALCTASGETADIRIEESKWFDVKIIKEAICSLREEPDRFTTTLPVATHVYSIININYDETEEIHIKPLKEKIAIHGEEINKFTTAQKICIGQCKTMDFEESILFEVAEIKYRQSLERTEPTVYRKILSSSTATVQSLNTVYDEVAILEPEIFKTQVALSNTEVRNFVRIQALCVATEKQSTVVFKEPELLLLTYEIKELFAKETLEPNRLNSALKITTHVTNELMLLYEEIKHYESSIATGKYVTTSVHVSELKKCHAISEAIVEHSHVNLYSLENSQIENFVPKTQTATVTIAPDVFKIAICTLNDVLQVTSTFNENVETQVIKKAGIGEQAISSSESQQYAKALVIREATLQDNHVSLESAHNKNLDKGEFEYLQLNATQKADYLKSFDTVKQAVVLVGDEKPEQRQPKKIIKRKTDTVKSKSAFIDIEKSACNINIVEKSEIKEANSYKQVSYMVSKSTGAEKTPESIQQTLHLNKNNQLKQSQLKEEIQREFLEIGRDLEEDSQIVIKDVTDVDETSDESCAIQIVQEATDIDSRRSSRELRLQAVEVEEISENEEKIASFVDYSIQERAKAAIDETAALKIVKQEEIEIACPVLEIEEIEEELAADMESITAESSDFISSAKLNEQMVNTKEIDEQLSRGTQESGVKIIKSSDMTRKAKSMKSNLESSMQKSITSVASVVSKELKSEEILTSEKSSSEMAIQMGFKHGYVQENIGSSVVSQGHKSKVLLTSEQSSGMALDTGLEHNYIQENIESLVVSQGHKSKGLLTSEQSAETALKMGLEHKNIEASAISQGFESKEVKTSRKSKELTLKTDWKHEHVQENVSKSIEATKKAEEFKSEKLLKKKSSKVALKTDSRYERGQENAVKNIESSTEVQTPAPPTPLIDEYIFRLVAPLPKSRSTTPVPKDPEPESSESTSHDDLHIVKKNLKPVVESDISENVQHSSPLPSTPTSSGHTPVYTKPGLNGGMMRLPRYIKPGLRGGSDRPSITKEEILEVHRRSSILASAITETLKNIERYKKEVGILKQEVATENRSEFDMEIDETIGNVNDKDDQKAERTELEKGDEDANKTKLDNENKKSFEEEKLQATSVMVEKDERKLTPDRLVKQDSEVSNVDEKYDNFSDAFEEVTLVDDIVADTKHDHSETIEECFDVIENEGQITEGVVEFPSDKVDDKKIQIPIAKEMTPDRPESLSTNVEEHVDKTEKQAEEELFGAPEEGPTINEEIVNVQLDAAADEEVARVTALTPDDERGVSKGRSLALSPRETELLKEAHVISLTRVLSAHMIRESLSPDPQRSIKDMQNVPVDKKDSSEGEKDRTWTSFLQKSTRPGPGQNLKHFADLQNKFEPKEQFSEKTDLRMSSEIKIKDFNSSPIPWQERALADTLGAPSVSKIEEPLLTPADPPEFLIAIPPASVAGSDKEVSPHPPAPEVPRIEIEHTKDVEDRNAVKVSVDKIVEEALRVAESLEIGEEKNRLIQLLSTNIKNITDSNFLVEDQLNKIRSQLQTLAQVPDIIRRALENLSEQLSVMSHKRKEENIVHEKILTTQTSEATIHESHKESKVPQEVIPLPQSKKEVDHKAEKMPAETRGTVTVTESTDKVTPQNAKEKIQAWPWGPSVVRMYRINFMKYEKPPIPLDHLQRSEVYKLIHDVDQAPPRRVETLRPAIAEADYRERCRSLSPCPPDTSKDQNPSYQFQP